MRGADELGGRRSLSEAEERDELRTGLFQRFRDDARYRNIVRQDLVPLWQAAAATGAWSRLALTFSDVLEAVDAFDPAHASGARSVMAPQRYVRAVTRLVGETMGLRMQGVPSTWALHKVHDDVIGKPRRTSLLSISPRVSDNDLSLSLDMTPNSISSRLFTGEDTGEPHRQDYDFTYFSVGYGTAHWTALRQTATLEIENAIRQMRHCIDERYPARNSAAIDGWERDLDLLFGVLFHRHELTARAETVRVRRLCERLAIDPPRRRAEAVVPYGVRATDDQGTASTL